VAPAEELFLRGLVQPLLRRTVGAGGAILVAAILFAAIHLPAYGWSAMPLDLGVGLLLGWLREETRSVAACITAHTLADLGSWFLA
jgi:membrane protease YdiL (CAAX protease family)